MKADRIVEMMQCTTFECDILRDKLRNKTEFCRVGNEAVSKIYELEQRLSDVICDNKLLIQVVQRRQEQVKDLENRLQSFEESTQSDITRINRLQEQNTKLICALEFIATEKEFTGRSTSATRIAAAIIKEIKNGN